MYVCMYVWKKKQKYMVYDWAKRILGAAVTKKGVNVE